jgi:hypothetical protein
LYLDYKKRLEGKVKTLFYVASVCCLARVDFLMWRKKYNLRYFPERGLGKSEKPRWRRDSRSCKLMRD